MPRYELRGIPVDFPFEAYDCQKAYIEIVIRALQEVRGRVSFSFLVTGAPPPLPPPWVWLSLLQGWERG